MKRNVQKPEPSPEQASAGEESGKTNGAPAKTNEPAESVVPFFEQLAAIDPNEWDAGRYRLYVYRLLPRIENQGENHYVGRLQSAVDEADILARFGSGRFHLKLNDTQSRKTIAAYTFTCHDPEFPPRIEGAQILNVPENAPYRSWIQRASSRQVGVDSGKQPGGSEEQNGHAAATAIQELAGIAKSALAAKTEQSTKEEREPAVSDTVANLVLEMAKGRDSLAKELVQQKAVDGLATVDRVLSIVEKLNTTRPTPKAEAQDPLDYVEKVLSLADRLRPVQSPSATGAGDGGNLATTRRSRMTGWQEMLQPAIPVVVDFLKPFAAGLATRLFASAGQPAPAPVGQATQPPSPAVPQTQPQNGAMPPLLNLIAGPMLNYMRLESDPHELGEDFASWVHEGFQADARFNSAIAMARAAGPNVIIAQFKGSPWWMDKGPNHDQLSLAEMEGKFGIFTQAFLNWQPQQDGAESDTPEVINIG